MNKKNKSNLNSLTNNLNEDVTLSLPINFFEKVMDLELKLAKEYKLSTFKELSNLFMQAIEYYESIGDSKFIDYSNRLNFLLKDPVFLKNINKKSISKDNTSKSKKDVIRFKSLAVKAKLNEENDELTLVKLMKEADEPSFYSKIIQTDLAKQSRKFKKRLDEIRKKKNSNSFIIDDCDTPNTFNKSTNLFAEDSKSNFFPLNDNDIIINISDCQRGHEEKETKEFIEGTIGFLMDSSIERKKSLNDSLFRNNRIFSEINDKIYNFLIDFNNYFNDNISYKYTQHMEKLMNEKYKKHLEICNYYDNQIKELEFLLVDSEESHKTSINEIIYSLENERTTSIIKNEETYKLLLKESDKKFQNIGFKNNKYIKSFEQKFQIDIYHLVDNILNPHS